MSRTLLREWLAEEPFTLTLSSGFFGFFAHAGVVKALEEADLLPRKLTGSSAGALIAGCWAGGMSAQDIKELLFRLRRQDFWDPGFGQGLLKGDKFRQLLADSLTVNNFSDCRAELCLSAYSMDSKQTIILNEGDLVSAIYASCAIPVMFQPITINNHRLLDGGIKDRPALDATEPGERIFYHHIASKSPWRRKNSSAIQVPKRDNLTSLVIHDLPRSGPFKLDIGQVAYQKAYQAAQKALHRTVVDGSVSVNSE
ncbi:patatin-like phospholipase family protein [Kangiella aquimarina]|uniref:Patatin-like phospholipase family protein n=1 Tax=Kangiella aquimarina TaxID=261965 RepID=A0ABZ0X5Z0_9GAMM|nr:patatin-like phospholipase family protein [Kangiella aquimarina]WQG86018.1 patatin-like phospholipase family protein [Kangiella aquimarina]